MGLKDEVKDMKEQLEETSFAMEMLQFSKEQNKQLQKNNKRLFIIWIVTFIGLLSCMGYIIYLLNDIEVIEETTTTQEVTQDSENGNNNFIGNDGDIVNGKAEDKTNSKKD